MSAHSQVHPPFYMSQRLDLVRAAILRVFSLPFIMHGIYQEEEQKNTIFLYNQVSSSCTPSDTQGTNPLWRPASQPWVLPFPLTMSQESYRGPFTSSVSHREAHCPTLRHTFYGILCLRRGWTALR